MLPILVHMKDYLLAVASPGAPTALDLKVQDVLTDWLTLAPGAPGLEVATFPPIRDVQLFVPKSQQFPQVAILPARSTQKYTAQPWSERKTWQASIVVISMHIDPAVCENILLVLTEAIDRMVALDGSLGDRVDGAFISDVSYTDAISRQKSGDVLQAAMMSVTVKSRIQFNDELAIR